MTDRQLVWTIGFHQLICWGTLHAAFPAFIAPMEAELGWSRAAISGAFSLALATSGLAAIPVGRWVDRRGARGVMTFGALLGGLLLVGWAAVGSLALFYGVFAALGVVHAMCLSDPAYAMATANSRDPRRTVAGITFFTGFCTAAFVPLGATMIEAVGWRMTLLAFALLEAVPAVLAFALLRGTRGSLSGAPPGATGAALARALRRPVFWLLTAAFCAQAFANTGIAFHILPLLAERGMPLASVLVIVAVHGPFQVAARALLVMLGARAGGSRRVGLVGFALFPPAMLILAFAPPTLAAVMPYAVLYGVSNGLLTIVRATGVAELLGREGFAQISGALTTALQVPRIAAPLALGLVWELAGGYRPVPWLLFGVSCLGLLAFLAAAREGRSAPGDG